MSRTCVDTPASQPAPMPVSDLTATPMASIAARAGCRAPSFHFELKASLSLLVVAMLHGTAPGEAVQAWYTRPPSWALSPLPAHGCHAVVLPEGGRSVAPGRGGPVWASSEDCLQAGKAVSACLCLAGARGRPVLCTDLVTTSGDAARAELLLLGKRAGCRPTHRREQPLHCSMGVACCLTKAAPLTHHGDTMTSHLLGGFWELVCCHAAVWQPAGLSAQPPFWPWLQPMQGRLSPLKHLQTRHTTQGAGSAPT